MIEAPHSRDPLYSRLKRCCGRATWGKGRKGHGKRTGGKARQGIGKKEGMGKGEWRTASRGIDAPAVPIPRLQ